MVHKTRPSEASRAGVCIRAKQHNIRCNCYSDWWCGSHWERGGKQQWKHVSSQERWVSVLLFSIWQLFSSTHLWDNSKLFFPSLSPFNPLDSASSASSVRSQSKLMSALYWLCGMERRNKEDDPAPLPAPEQTICSLEEKPRLQLIVNANLIICLSVTAFIIGYWAWWAVNGQRMGCMKDCRDLNVLFFHSL